MNHWAFVFAAYSATVFSTVGLTAWAFLAMRRAEADAEAIKRRQ